MSKERQLSTLDERGYVSIRATSISVRGSSVTPRNSPLSHLQFEKLADNLQGLPKSLGYVTMSSKDITSFPNAQFLRIEKYARVAGRGKGGANTIYKIANEAMRINGFCDHITSPVAPTILFGVSPIEAVQMSEKWAASQCVEYLHKPSSTLRNRKMRSDKACLVVGVISVPPSWNVDAKWTDFTNASIDWLRSLYSERLKSVVAHLDEHCLHIHYWLIPNNDESIGRVHPGEAELQRVGFGAPRIVRETAYKKAMTSMLDDFELRVTSKFGLLRRTVNKRRLSRQEWIRQKWLAAENKSLIKNSAIESEDKDKKISSANQLSYSDSGFSEPIVTVAPSAEMSGPEYPTEGLGIFGQWIIALRHDEEVRQVDRPVF